jgi:hypothetical protein
MCNGSNLSSFMSPEATPVRFEHSTETTVSKVVADFCVAKSSGHFSSY